MFSIRRRRATNIALSKTPSIPKNPDFPSNVVVFCPILRNNMWNHHLIQAAVALEDYGHKVALLTSNSKFSRKNREKLDLPIYEVGRIIPESVCGYFRKICYFLKAFVLAFWCLIFCKPRRDPGVILYNEPHLTLSFLKRISNFRFIQFQSYDNLSTAGAKKIHKVFDLACADELLLPSKVAVQLACKGRARHNVEMQPLYPAVDTGVFRCAVVKAKSEILPIMTEESSYFITYGEFSVMSHFHLALRAFHSLRQNIRIDLRKKLYLVFAGSHDGLYDVHAYSNFVAKISSLSYYNNLIFRRELNTVERKSLIYHSVAVLLLSEDTVYDRVYFEAMALGKPIISLSSISFAKEIIEHKNTGYLMPRNPHFIGNLLKFLLQKKPYAKVVGQLAANQFNNKYSFMAFAANLDSIMKCYSIYEDNTSARREFNEVEEPVISSTSQCSELICTDIESNLSEDQSICETISRTSLVTVVTDQCTISPGASVALLEDFSSDELEEAGNSLEQIIRDDEEDPEDSVDQVIISMIELQGLSSENFETTDESGVQADNIRVEQRHFSGIAYKDYKDRSRFETLSSFEKRMYPKGPRSIIQRYHIVFEERELLTTDQSRSEIFDNLTEDN